ncbi:MAG TPA: thioredoxin family protein [Chryseosolibacter sp.]|nr:thioredoxin family protein [Chryseosolibacter sp.]
MKATVLSFLLLMTHTVTWLNNFDEAKSVAVRDNKYILLNFSGSDWCGPCIKMKKEVFESEAFLQLADRKLVLLRADFPRSKKNRLPLPIVEHNEKLADRYNPHGKFPYTLLLNADGTVIKEWDGYVFSSQDEFIEDLTQKLESR